MICVLNDELWFVFYSKTARRSSHKVTATGYPAHIIQHHINNHYPPLSSSVADVCVCAYLCVCLCVCVRVRPQGQTVLRSGMRPRLQPVVCM